MIVERRDVGVMPDLDGDLVAAWRTGDDAAAVRAFTLHGPAVRRFLARITGACDHDLDDLVQQTFLHAHRGIRRFRGNSSLLTWLFGISMRSSWRSRRARRRRQHAYDRLAVESCASAAPLDVVAREQLRLLVEALGLLDEKLRVAFVLSALEQVPGVEAAVLLGIPEGTLARRVHAAREQLRLAVERSRP